MQMLWLPNPPDGTACAGGFDGSENEDWTAIKLVTRDRLLFTPRYGPNDLPTIWDPTDWGGEIPRDEIDTAWAEIADRYRLKRVYCDPPGYRSEISKWGKKYGEDVFLEWPTNKAVRMHPALQTFMTDLKTRTLTHDGCPITTQHIANAHRKAQPGDKFILAKPAGQDHRKIDVAVTSVIAVEAANDAHRAGWTDARESKLTRVRGRTSTH